jgi:uncharacterized membrane protein (UPF0127 family)
MTLPAERSLVTESGLVVARHVEIAADWWSRFKGLQFRNSLPEEHAILLRPCSSIHTFWMRFAIDVVFLDSDGRIADIRRTVRPWRAVLPESSSVAVLEMTSGALPIHVSHGDLLCWSDGERRWPLTESSDH